MGRVLLTGGAGFIGGYLVNELQGHHDVIVLDNLSVQIHGEDPNRSPLFKKIQDRCEFVRGSVTDYDVVTRVLDGVDYVIHLAAETGTGQSMYELRQYADTNILGQATLLEAVVREHRTVKQVVLSSSRSVYGEGKYQCAQHGVVFPGARDVETMRAGDFDVKCPHCATTATMLPTDEKSDTSPASFYAYTKLSQEQMLQQVCASIDLPYTIMRYQNVYGAGQSLNNPYTGILSIFSRQLIAGSTVNVYEDGDESRDFVHVSDVARLTASTLGRDAAHGQIINVGTGQSHTVTQVAESLKAAYSSSSEIGITGDFRKGDIRGNVADISFAREILHDSARVAFDDGIRDLSRWVLAEISRMTNGSTNVQESIEELKQVGMLIEGAGK